VARVTVEDCLDRFPTGSPWSSWRREGAPALRGRQSLVKCDNKPGVAALREIAQGQVRFNESVEAPSAYLGEIRGRDAVPSAALASSSYLPRRTLTANPISIVALFPPR